MKNETLLQAPKTENLAKVLERRKFNMRVGGAVGILEGLMFLIWGSLAAIAALDVSGKLVAILVAVAVLMVGIGLGLMIGAWLYLRSDGTSGKGLLVVSTIVTVLVLGGALLMDLVTIVGPTTNRSTGVRMVLEFAMLGGGIVILFALFQKPQAGE